MHICKCGGTIRQHPLTETEANTREAWTCNECARYEIITRTKEILQESQIAIDGMRIKRKNSPYKHYGHLMRMESEVAINAARAIQQLRDAMLAK